MAVAPSEGSDPVSRGRRSEYLSLECLGTRHPARWTEPDGTIPHSGQWALSHVPTWRRETRGVPTPQPPSAGRPGPITSSPSALAHGLLCGSHLAPHLDEADGVRSVASSRGRRRSRPQRCEGQRGDRDSGTSLEPSQWRAWPKATVVIRWIRARRLSTTCDPCSARRACTCWLQRSRPCWAGSRSDANRRRSHRQH